LLQGSKRKTTKIVQDAQKKNGSTTSTIGMTGPVDIVISSMWDVQFNKKALVGVLF
jgi:hypothetical protein